MNRKRRELLARAIYSLESAESQTRLALDQEQDCFDNIPENLQYSDGYDKMQEAIDELESAADKISEAIDGIRSAMV